MARRPAFFAINSDEFPVLIPKLNEALSNDGIALKYIDNAQSQALDGTNYHVTAKALKDGIETVCCFSAHESRDGEFKINCSDCGNCKCFSFFYWFLT